MTQGNFDDGRPSMAVLLTATATASFLAIAETRSLSADFGTFGDSTNRAWSKLAPLVGHTNVVTLFNVCNYKYAHVFDKGCAFVCVTVSFK